MTQLYSRRQALLAMTLSLSGGAVLLAGCGSGSGSRSLNNGTGGSAGGSTGPARSTGRVVLPPGSPLTLANLKLTSGFSPAALKSDGAFTLEQMSGDAALLVLTDANGQPLLMGFSGNAATGLVGEVSPAQTAVALLFYALGAFTLPAEAQERVRILLAEDSRTQALATNAAQILAANPLALSQSDSPLFAAAAILRDTLLGSAPTARHETLSRRSRQTMAPTLISVRPENEVNGFRTSPNADGLGLTITNSRRRNAFAYIYQAAYTTEGADSGPQDDVRTAPVNHKIADPDFVSATSGLAGVVGSLIDYANGTVVYSPVISSPYSLDLFPQDAKSSEYYIDLIGNGNDSDPQNIRLDNPDYLNIHDIISFITFVKDLLLPAIATIAGFQGSLKLNLTSGAGYPGTELIKAFDDLAVIMSGVIDSGFAIRQSSVRSLLIAVLKALENNGTLRQKFIEWVTLFFARQGIVQGTVAIALGSLATALNALVVVVDKLLGGADIGAVLADWGASASYTRFEAKVIAPKVRISPAAATLQIGKTLTLTANTPVNEPNLTFQWTITQGKGTLKNTTSGLTGSSVDSSEPTVEYQTDAGANTTEKVSVQVEAFLGGVNDSHRQSIGKDTTTITLTDEKIIEPGIQYEDYSRADFLAAGMDLVPGYGDVVVSYAFPVDQTSGYYLIHGAANSQGQRTGYRVNVRDILAATSLSDKTPPVQGVPGVAFTIAEPIPGQYYDGRAVLFHRRGGSLYFFVVERVYPFIPHVYDQITDGAGTIAWIKSFYSPSFFEVQVTWRSG